MTMVYKSSSFVAAVALAAATFFPTTVLGQASSGERSSGGANYHLMQLSVGTANNTLDEFKAKTEAIRSCADGRQVAKALQADVKIDRFVPSWNLPNELKSTLSEMSTGRATQVFSNDPSVMRVLVICHRL